MIAIFPFPVDSYDFARVSCDRDSLAIYRNHGIITPSRNTQVTAQVGNDITVKIAEKTDYPFEEKIDFNLSFPSKKDKKAFFPFHLRIPAWCNNPVITIFVFDVYIVV